jgi:hypothetical protein
VTIHAALTSICLPVSVSEDQSFLLHRFPSPVANRDFDPTKTSLTLRESFELRMYRRSLNQTFH